jgi:hypothetical protein
MMKKLKVRGKKLKGEGQINRQIVEKQAKIKS